MAGIRLPLVLAFVLAAALSLTNVSAYKQAVVTSGMTMTVDSTTSAALAISSVSPMATVSAGRLGVDFRKGNGASREMRYDATYPDVLQMRDVFRITNNGANCQAVQVFVPGGGTANLTGIYGRRSGVSPPGTQLATTGGTATANTVLLGASGSGTNVMLVDFDWQASNTVTAGTFTVRVSSNYSAICP